MTRPFTHALALLPCLMIASVASAAEKAPWVWAGSYVYEHDGGRTVGGSPIVVTYRLDIAPGRGNRDCVLRIEGFQTNETIVCKAAGTVDSIMVSFHTFGDGRIVNAYGTRLYDVGTNLFEIRRVGEAVSTQWRALNPSGAGSSAPAGTSFARKG
ncbi:MULTISPECIES: DUF5991 domain-containing protein [unclassified Methylobacterium]|uniref:DUF5991 domain-containing protein n=1 Tax=unclassified Methylobacterium TaxID=2615210 RepID=UPI0006FB06B3|nr:MULTISPECIES: DUF5991 domain-containing protein [unclassified Methylobacterium]KQP88408.1 hypothetical protein ASF57_09555 [Methylobacterium sp. Leaf117]MCK2054452.1 hypothetical protein [Methylobacterium sp. 37f]